MSHLLSGAAATPITGTNCLHIILKSGSFSRTVSASQHKVGNNFITGVYSASFAISQFESLLAAEVRASNSASFTEIWSSIDENVGFHTGSNKFIINVISILLDLKENIWLHIYHYTD